MLKNINLVFHRILSGLHLQPPRRKTLISMYLVLLFTPISFSYQPNVGRDNFPLISAELNWLDRPSNESKSGTCPWPRGRSDTVAQLLHRNINKAKNQASSGFSWMTSWWDHPWTPTSLCKGNRIEKETCWHHLRRALKWGTANTGEVDVSGL